MMTLIREGGIPMWFILLFGLLALGGSVWYAMAPEPRRLGLVRGMSAATLFSTLSGTAAAVGATLHTLAGGRIPEYSFKTPDGPLFLMTGLAESMSAMIMGFSFLALVGLICAVGAVRQKN